MARRSRWVSANPAQVGGCDRQLAQPVGGRLPPQGPRCDLDVHGGEVIGLAGMEGSGQGLFLRAVGGMIRTVGGKVLVNGKDLTGKSYHAFKNRGVAFLPASRLEEGLVPGSDPDRTFHPGRRSRQVSSSTGTKADQLAEQRIQEFNIRGTPANTVESLSGGNQQRALLALLRDTADPAAAGTPHPRPGHRIHHLHLEQAQGTLPAGALPSFSFLPTWRRSCNTATGCWSSSAAR